MARQIIGATARCAWVLALIMLVGLASRAAGSEVPLTPHGVAPQVYRGNTHPDSVASALAATGSLAHRPLAMTATLQGVDVARAGDDQGAAAHWEVARRLDPAYPSAILAPARFLALSAPRSAFRALSTLPAGIFGGFAGQQSLASNLLVLIFFPLLIATCASAFMIFTRHASQMHHLYWEHFHAFLPRSVAKWAVWGLFALPLVWNLGFLFWATMLIAAAFPMLARAEKRFAVACLVIMLIAPLGVRMVAIVSAPADPRHPASGLWRAQQGGSSPQAMAEIRRLERRHPEEGILKFTESLLARQAGDLVTARRALAEAEETRALPEDRFHAAWGILAYHEGNVEEAIRRLDQATQAAPDRFDLRYNLSKAYARASLFLKADREMREAFALDGERVRFEERRRLQDLAADLIEERLPALDLWRLVGRRGPGRSFRIPRSLAGLFPGGNPSLLWLCVLLPPLAALLSHRWHRRLRIHACCQCGRTVCRRCLKRRDRRIYCEACALTAGRWAQAQYTQLLLTRLLGRHDRVRDRILNVARLVIPGLGASLRGKIDRAFLQLLVSASAVLWIACQGVPLKPLPWSQLEQLLIPSTATGITALILVEIWVLNSELRGLRKRTHLKEFLGAAKPRAPRARVA